MAGAWLRELLPVAWKRRAGRFEACEGGQTAGLNAIKNRWLGRGCENCCQLLGKGAREDLKRLKRLMAGAWLRELVPVAWERPARGFEAFEGRQTAGLNALKNRWPVCGCENCCQLPGKGLREGLKRLKRLRAGKRQARTSLKTDGWGVAARIVASCLQGKGLRIWFEAFERQQTATPV